MPTWRVNLLGEFALLSPDGREVPMPGRKHQALVAYVVLSGGRSVSRSRLLELLWNSRSEAQARASLRGVLSEIRRTLRDYGEPFLEADRARIFIGKERLDVDVDRLRQALRFESVEDLAGASALYRGHLMESLTINERTFEEWKQLEQQNARTTCQQVLLRYLDALEAAGDDRRVETVANRLLELDDADEAAHRALMRLFARQGKVSRSLQQFEDCRMRLRSRYGSDVSEETHAQRAAIGAAAADADPEPDVDAGRPVGGGLRGSDAEIALAVLPFNVVGAEQTGPEFGELVGEEIIGAAARFKWFRVVPSSATFKKEVRGLGSAEVAAITGAKYVLHGRIRGLKNVSMLSVELVDGNNQRTVWSERFELSREAFSYPDDIVARVVGRLDVRMRASEISQAHRLERDSLSPYQLTLLALSNMYDMSLATYEDSERLFAEAVKRNPNDSWFYSIWALWKMFCLGQDWTADRAGEFVRAAELARQAIKRDPDDALALVIAGHFESLWVRNLHQGRKLVDASLELNPYSSFAWMLSSATYTYSGRPLEALQRLERSRLLCPVETHFEYLFDTANCIAHLFNKDPENAVEWGLKTVRENPGFTHGHKHLLVALGHLGRVEECVRYARRLMEIEPGFQVESFLDSYPFARDEDRRYYREGLVRAMSLSAGHGESPS